MKMNLAAYLQEKTIQGWTLWVEGDKLKFRAPNNQHTAHVLEVLKERKAEIIALLSQTPDLLNIYTQTSVQSGLWYSWQMAPTNAAFNIAIGLSLCSEIDVQHVKESLKLLNQRHAILRSRFFLLDGVLCQHISQDMQLDFEHIDANNWDDAYCKTQVTKYQQQPFDLERGQLIRVKLFSIAENEHLLLFVVHHIISDALSQGILTEEFLQIYGSLMSGSSLTLAEQPHSFLDYVEWQKNLIASDKGNNLWAYWHNKLHGELPLLNLPLDFDRPKQLSYHGKSVSFELSADLAARVKKLAKDLGVTPYVLLLTVYKVLLYRYSNQTEILVGSPMSGRTRPEFRMLVGCFVNPVVLRDKVSGDYLFMDFLAQVQQTVLEAIDHQDYPFPLLVEKLNLPRNSGHAPVYQATFNLHNFNLFSAMQQLLSTGEAELNGLHIKRYNLVQQEGQGDLYLEMIEAEEALYGAFKYNSDLFSQSTIDRFVRHFLKLLEGVTNDPTTKIADLELLTSEEKQELLVDFNDTYVNYPKERAIHTFFEERVLEQPYAIALVTDQTTITYVELNTKANQLARYIQKKGGGLESVVAIALERSVNMIVSIFAALKVGAAYLPIDPSHPAERIQYFLDDSKPAILITDSMLSDRIPIVHPIEVVCLDNSSTASAIEREGQLNINVNVPSDHLAYIIYTSGSSGKPKGTLITHQALANRLTWMQAIYPIDGSDTLLQKTTYTFDVSVWEILWWSMAGAKLALLKPGGEKDPEEIVKAIEKHAVTVIHFVPSMYKVFLDHVETLPDLTRMHTLKQIFASGEALTPSLLEGSRALIHQNGMQLTNLYGPTEATIDVSWYNCRLGDTIIPIGKPIANTQLFILDNYGNPVPIGVAGELCIAGDGLARAYLNRPALTAEKFVYKSLHNQSLRLYKTGDLARYLADGNIEYLGRIDNQVKIRGFRIELGEIEALLNAEVTVKAAVVLADNDHQGSKRIVAYIVSSENGSLKAKDLRSSLAKRLPEYMIPGLFIEIEELPLTNSGKVNLKVLPKPSAAFEMAKEYLAPETETEKRLAEIWKEVLGLERVGIYADFFELGGHSLLATQIMSKIRTEFKQELPLMLLFENATIQGIAAFIDRKEASHNDQAILRAENVNVGDMVFKDNPSKDTEVDLEEFNL